MQLDKAIHKDKIIEIFQIYNCIPSVLGVFIALVLFFFYMQYIKTYYGENAGFDFSLNINNC